MKNIKILVATHKKYQMPENDIYIPIHVGREGKEDLGFQGDNTGEHISNKNSSYCELTGIFWAWKNLNCEYIGVTHYRRHFSNKGILQQYLHRKEKLTLIPNEEEIKNWLSEYDMILPKKRNYYIETIRSHYKNAHNINDLNEVKNIISETYPAYIQSFEKVMQRRTLHLYNMFIMKKGDYDKYCDWLFSILFELEKRIDISSYDTYQSRVFGFISERLFNVWILHNKAKVKEINVVNVEGVNWYIKIKAFLKRKTLNIS